MRGCAHASSWCGQIHTFTIWNVYVNLHVFRPFDKNLSTLLPGGEALPTDEQECHAGPSAEPRSNEGSHGVDAGDGESATTALTATLSAWHNLYVQLDVGAVDFRGPSRREAERIAKSHEDAGQQHPDRVRLANTGKASADPRERGCPSTAWPQGRVEVRSAGRHFHSILWSSCMLT